MSKLQVKQLLEAGAHFGHQTHKWNPKMKKYVYGERNGIYIIDLQQTLPLAEKAYEFLKKTSQSGKSVLFVGTKRQASDMVKKKAEECGAYHVTSRWLGGMLTNWRTIQKSLRKLQDYREAEARGDWNLLKKQEVARKKREQQRLEKYLGGLESMTQLPGVVIIVGQPEEIHAVRECRQLGIPTVTLLDSNCDPTLADWFIPANDDSVSALRLILDSFETAIINGQKKFDENQSLKNAKLASKQTTSRKSGSGKKVSR